MPGSSRNLIEDAFQAGRNVGTHIERVGDVTYSLHQSSENDADRKKLEKEILKWINEKVGSQGLKVRDCLRDLRTGEIFIRLLEVLSGNSIEYNRFAQNEVSYKANLQILLKWVQVLGVAEETDYIKWSVDDLYMGNPGIIYSIAVAIAHKYKCPYSLPNNVVIHMVRREMIRDGTIVQKTVSAQVTGEESKASDGAEDAALEVNQLSIGKPGGLVGARVGCELDEVTSDCEVVVIEGLRQPIGDQTLVGFANENLSIIERTVSHIENDFSSGELFILLLASVGRFFVPTSAYRQSPVTIDDKVYNVRVLFAILDQLEVPRKGVRTMGIIEGRRDGGSKLLLEYIFAKFND